MPGGPKEEPFPAVSPRATQIITSSGQSGPEPAIRPGITERQMLSVPPSGIRGAGRWGLGSHRNDIEPPDRALARLEPLG